MTSDPLGATVFVDDTQVGTTPVRVSLRRRQPTTIVRFEKEGFRPERIAVRRSVSGRVAVNAIALNPLAAQGMDSIGDWAASASIGFSAMMATDFLTGGAYKFPKVVRVVLAPEIRSRMYQTSRAAAMSCEW